MIVAEQLVEQPKIPLVLVHGWGMNTGVWKPVLPLLTDKFDVIPLELPGHGHAASTTRHVADWVDYCLQQAPSEAVWLGWSLGGQIAMQAANLHPERFLGLILLASTPRFTSEKDWPNAVSVDVFDNFGRALDADVSATLNRFLALQVRGSRDAMLTLKKIKADFNARPLASKVALEDGLYLLKNLDLRKNPVPAEIPTTWVFGQRDTLIPTEVKNDIDNHMHNTHHVVIKGAGHAPFISHPENVMHVLTEFVNAHGI